MYELSGSEREELQKAILDAYPDIGDLEMVVSFKFNKNLTAIAGGNNDAQIIFKLIRWAEAHGDIKTLIDGLYNDNPRNENLAIIYDKIIARFDSNERSVNHKISSMHDKVIPDYEKKNYHYNNQNNKKQIIQQPNKQLPQPPNQENYQHLNYLLKNQQWEEANEETLTIMNQVYGRTTTDSWQERDIQEFPCDILCQIDKLWRQYSNNYFGFTIQTMIWERQCTNLAHPEEAFGNYVGWYDSDRNRWLLYSDPAFRAKVRHQYMYKGILPTLTSKNYPKNYPLKVNASFIPHLVERLQFCE
ncbi:MAG: GUN4 domain-containing protein, partial [Moorea sp. SIO1F2]|uniref:GUN4 domain-containing protein n=1 Tax=Moorena sp. SIO1F2 TaxID=2607819 RepID=UPI0013BCDA9B